MERMTAYLIENFAGALPLWLSPMHARVIPVSSAYDEYARQVEEKLLAAGIRAESDVRNEKLGYKIREAQLEKLPYMLIVGDNEAQAGTVSVRKRGEGDIGVKPVAELIELLNGEIAAKTV
jgi:threonyl-tRNA synthetase